MNNFIIATKNKKKLIELERILKPLGVDIVSENDGFHLPDVIENGVTFMENARLKALSAMSAAGLPAIADDSGLCVDALDGRPGVFSARYGGEGLSDTERYLLLLEEMDGVINRKAHFACAICVCYPDGREITAYGECHGKIALKAAGDGGFGYDPVFLIDGRSFAKIPPEEKDKLSHRSKALSELKEKLKNAYK